MRKPDIVTFCVRGFPGTNRSLMNLEKTARLSRHFVLASSSQDAPEIKFFINYLKTERPKLLVFGGWSAIYEIFLTSLKKEKIRFGMYWTSSPGQVDISGEVDILPFLIKDSRIKHRLFANREFALSLSRHVGNVDYLPDTLVLPLSNRKTGEKREKNMIISLFCSPFEYKRKNILNALLAVSMLKNDYLLYLNGLSKNKYYKIFLQSLNIRYRDFGWMAEKKYQDTLEAIDLGLQVSFAETFNHVVAEHILRGVPVITSHMVPVMDNMPNSIKKRLIVDVADNPLRIKEKIEFLANHPEVRIELGQKALASLRKENEKNIRIAKRVLKNITNSI